jgi:hypothetical protein
VHSHSAEISSERLLHSSAQLTWQRLPAAARLLDAMLYAGLDAREIITTTTLD